MKIYQWKNGEKEFRFVSALGVYWSLGMLFLTAGLGLLAENLWVLIFKASAETLMDAHLTYVSEIIGGFCILIGISLVFLALRTVKNDFYREVYEYFHEMVYALGTMTNNRLKEVDDAELQNLEENTQSLYEKSLERVERYRLKMTESEYNELKEIHTKVVKEISFFHAYRNKIDKWQNDIQYRTEYNPYSEQKETIKSVGEIFESYNSFVSNIREKLKFTLELPKVENLTADNK